MPATELPDVASALNRVQAAVAWRDNGRLTKFSNVALAREVSSLLGETVHHTLIARIRNDQARNVRGLVVWAIARALSTKAAVEITPDYFYVAATRARVNRELDLELERLTTELQRGQGSGDA